MEKKKYVVKGNMNRILEILKCRVEEMEKKTFCMYRRLRLSVRLTENQIKRESVKHETF